MKKIIGLIIFLLVTFLLITNFHFILYKISFAQQGIIEKISVLIEEKKEYLFYIILSLTFIYGLVHSIGPGHGKTLVMTYSIKNRLSIGKLFVLSFIIAYLESLVAYLVIKFLIDLGNRTSMMLFYNLDNRTRLVASIFIILIGLYNLYSLLKDKDCHHCGETEGTKNIFFLSLILGLCPCPGVMSVLLFLEGLNYGEYLFLFAMSTATGIFLVIFLSGLLVTKFKNIFVSERDRGLQKKLAYIGALFLVIFGLLQIYIIF